MNTVEPTRSGHDSHEIIQILFLLVLVLESEDGNIDYGFPGFEIHQIHNPWILDGFGFHKQWADGFFVYFKSIWMFYGF